MSDLLTAAPLSGFLPGYQQGQEKQRQQAIDIANQIAQQHQDELAQQQAEFAQRKQDAAEAKQQALQDQFDRKQKLAETIESDKKTGREARIQEAVKAGQLKFDTAALERIRKDEQYRALQGDTNAHENAKAAEISRQFGLPNEIVNRDGGIPFDMTGQQTHMPAIVAPNPADAGQATPPNGGNIALPNLTPPPSAPPENPAGAALGNFGAGSVGGATTALPNTAIAPTPIPSLLSIPSLSSAVTTGQATPSAPAPQIGTPPTPDLVSVPSVANVFGTGQPTAMPPAPIVGSSAAPVPSPAPVGLPPPAQALQNAVQPPTTITTPGHSGQLIPGNAPGPIRIIGDGPLPMVGKKMKLTDAKIEQSQASTANTNARTEATDALLEPRLADIYSKISHRTTMDDETKNYHKDLKANADARIALDTKLKTAQLALQQAARNDAHQGAVDRHIKAVTTPTPQTMVAFQQLAKDKAESVNTLNKVTAERDKMIGEHDVLAAAYNAPQPVRSSYDTDTKFNDAVNNWNKARLYAKTRTATLDKRIGEQNDQIKGLNSSIHDSREALGQWQKVQNPDGSFKPAITPPVNPGAKVNPSVSAPSPLQASAVQKATSLLGTPYHFGGADANSTDCSGLLCQVYPGKFDHGARDQFNKTQRIEREDLQPGDAVFLTGTDRNIPRGQASHVGLYVGNGNIIAASSAKGKVVTQSLNSAPWNHMADTGSGPAVLGYGRVTGRAPKTAPPPASTSGKTNPAPTRTAAPTRYIYNPATGKMTPAPK